MRTEIYLSLLIFCVIFPKGLATLSEVNIQKSSDLQIRKKRLIDRTSYGGRPVRIEKVPYIVNILQNGVSCCGGIILAPNIILSAAHCFLDRNVTHTVLSGSQHSNRGVVHKIMRRIIYPDFRAHLIPDDLAILIISPQVDLIRSRNRRIVLYNGKIRPKMLGTFSGWGCNHVTENTFNQPPELRSITVPILSLEECQNAYQNFAVITDKDICTLDKKRQKCGSFGDCGGPLVINRRLVGVMVWSRVKYIPAEYPDVFINLLYRPYRNWILSIMHDFRV